MYRKTLSEICPRVFFSSLESATLKNIVFLISYWKCTYSGDFYISIKYPASRRAFPILSSVSSLSADTVW